MKKIKKMRTKFMVDINLQRDNFFGKVYKRI